jgi:medium-chain acyl-[acyl-carrier-protein] hydrolase
MSDLADEPFVAEMQARYGAIPDAVLADRDLLALLLPGLRADVAVLESYRYRPGAPLDCPVVALGGTEDPHARPSELEPWQAETRAGFSLHLLPGAHFFLHSSQPELMSIIERTLAAPDSAARVA